MRSRITFTNGSATVARRLDSGEGTCDDGGFSLAERRVSALVGGLMGAQVSRVQQQSTSEKRVYNKLCGTPMDSCRVSWSSRLKGREGFDTWFQG